MKKTKENKAITLVALVVTLIILLILAGISISALTQTGLFEKAKEAKQKNENTQKEENLTLASYEKEISKFISSNRNGQENAVSLINKEDGIYNKDQNGYIFNTAINQITYSTNNIITLSESIENYKYLEFECDNTYATYGFSYPFAQRFTVSQIKEHYNDTNEFIPANIFWLIYDSGDTYNRIAFWFKDNKTIAFQYGRSGNTALSKIRITNIKGIH